MTTPRPHVLVFVLVALACVPDQTPTPPVVSSTQPVADAVDVPATAVIEARFDRPLDPSTVNAQTFVVDGVTGSVSWDGARNAAVFTPAADLPGGATLTAAVTTGVRSAEGRPLASPHSWSFTVAEPAVPVLTVSATDPVDGATGVDPSAPVSITFHQALDGARVGEMDVQVVPAGGGWVVAGSLAVDGGALTFTPSAPHAENTTYEVTVSEAWGADGRGLSGPEAWSFTTRGDETAPSLVSTSPATGAVDASLSTQVSFFFDEPLDPATVTAANVTLSPDATGTVAWVAAENAIRFTPGAALTASTTYTATVSTAVTDAAGNALDAPASVSFTTLTPDPTRPSVVWTSVVADEQLERTHPQMHFRVQFSEAIDPDTLAGELYVGQGENAHPRVSGFVSWDSDTLTATFTTNTSSRLTTYPLDLGANVLKIRSGIQSPSGGALDKSYSIPFTVVDTLGPVLLEHEPSALTRLIGTRPKLRLRFDELIPDGGGNWEAVYLERTDTAERVQASVSIGYYEPTVTLYLPEPLELGAPYALVITSSLVDSYGNPFEGPVRIPFQVMGPATPIGGVGIGLAERSAVAEAANGDRLAAWVTSSGSAKTVEAARFVASSGTWEPPQAVTGGQGQDVQLWSTPGGAFLLGTGERGPSFRAFDGTAWSEGGPTVGSFDEWRVASNDEGFLVFVEVPGQSLHLHAWTPAGGWTLTELALTFHTSVFAVSGAGAGFTLAYLRDGKTLEARTFTGGVLGDPVVLAQSTAADADYVAMFRDLRMVELTAGPLVVWTERADGASPWETVRSAEAVGGAFGAAETRAVDDGASISDVRLAASGASAALWLKRSTATEPEVHVYDGSSWASPVAMTGHDAYSTLVEGPAGFGFLASSRADALIGGVWQTPYEPGYLNDETRMAVGATAAVLVRDVGSDWAEVHTEAGGFTSDRALGVGDARYVSLARGATLMGFVRDGVAHALPLLDGVEAVAELPPASGGDVLALELEADASGALLAAWRQRVGLTSEGFVAWRTGTEWTAPLSLGAVEAGPWIATDGARFVVAYRAGGKLETRLWDGGVLGAATEVADLSAVDVAAPIDVVSDGARWLLAAAVTGGTSAWLTADPAAWGSPTEVGDGATPTRLQLAASGDDFGLVTRSPNGFSARAFDETWLAASLLNGSSYQDFNLAGGLGGLAVIYGYGTTGQGGRIAHWTAASPSWSVTSFFVNVDAAPLGVIGVDGAGFMALGGRDGRMLELFHQTDWTQGRQLPVACSSDGGIVSGPDGWAILCRAHVVYVPRDGSVPWVDASVDHPTGDAALLTGRFDDAGALQLLWAGPDAQSRSRRVLFVEGL